MRPSKYLLSASIATGCVTLFFADPLRRNRSRILYLDHVEDDGRLLFEQITAMDLEGIVCKQKSSPYKVTEKPWRHWIKVKNPKYSQLEGREGLFEPV